MTKREITLMAPECAENDHLVNQIVELVNAVYGETESDFFIDNYKRTDEDEIRTYIRAGEIAAIYDQDDHNPSSPHVIGCIRTQKLSASHGEFGMLALRAECRGTGAGRDLVQFAEEHCRSSGLTVMQLELLSPRDYEHQFKQRLLAWYSRLGYKLVRIGAFEAYYPKVAVQLKCPCLFRVFEKALV